MKVRTENPPRSTDVLERHGTDDLVLHTMATLDLSDPESEGGQFEEASGPPGDNDPNFRTAAFAHGISRAIEPLIDAYVEADDTRSINDIFNSTFRLTFHYSAGSPLVQSLFQLRISQLLCDKYGELALIRAAASAQLDVDKFVVPANHAGGRALRRAHERLPAIWEFYMDIAKM